MYCYKCGTKINESDKFCKNCGANLSDNFTQQFAYIDENITDDDLKKAYIGNNADKLKSGRFSLPTLLLGIYYLLYRKMWLCSILWLIVVVVSNILAFVYKISYLSILPLVYIIILSSLFTNLYSLKVEKAIKKIKQNNQDKSNKELINICKRKGGVSIASVIILIVAVVLISIFVCSVYIAEQVEKTINNKYDKNRYYNNKSELIYKLPDIFELNKHESDSYESFRYYGNQDSCTGTITNYKIYSEKSPEDYLRSSITTNMNETIGEIKTIEINNNMWSYVDVISQNKTTYYYASIYNDRIYQITYTIYDDESKLCSKSYEEFINSLTFNKINDNINSV